MVILVSIITAIAESICMVMFKFFFMVIGKKVFNRRDPREMKEEGVKLQTLVKNCNQVIEALTVSNRKCLHERNFAIGVLMVIGVSYLLFRSRN